MHHHLYPTEDAFISNKSLEEDKNFGIDEMLSIGVSHSYAQVLNDTKTYHYGNEFVSGMPFENFTGILTGSFFGIITDSLGTIVGTGNKFTASYFAGNVSGSISGYETGSAIISTNFDGTFQGFSGNIDSYTINGNVSGSIIANCFSTFTGQLTSSTGNISGYVTGNEIKNEQNITTTDTQYINRSLIKFDLSFISKSIVDGDITSPKFFLKLKNTQAKELPIQYKIYAFPVSQSWVNGDGYWCDGGSDTGVSWNWRDSNSGSLWFSPHVTTPIATNVDYINFYSLATESFSRGGGTWYNLPCTQSFNYETSDINMDVTTIVNSWLSNTYPNNGFLLMYGGETSTTSSNSQMYFFSKDTNTIYSPVLDIAWDDTSWVIDSYTTSSVSFVTMSSGISSSIQSGSSFVITGGVSGSFSADTFTNISDYYVTASNILVNGSFVNFSGSFTGSFVTNLLTFVNGFISGSSNILLTSYFSGSIDNVSVETMNSSVSGSEVIGIITGSSATSASYVSYFEGSITSPTNHPITISGNIVTASYLSDAINSVSGMVEGVGVSGSIIHMPVIGNYSGLLEISSSKITGTFSNGTFSGSTFISDYINYKLNNAILTGSWNEIALLGTNVNIPLPSTIYPYAHAYVTGSYINGKTLGLYQVSGSNSASFNGQFIDGTFLGGYINVQLSGSVYTSSFITTGSVEITSSILSELDITKPFVVIIQDLKKEYSFGDIVRIGVFGREHYPLKTFAKAPQQPVYITPKYLPTSSYYAIKDNETEEIIVDFDNYTKLSCDVSGNYFVLDTTGLSQERYYKVLVRVVDSVGKTYTFDSLDLFKIRR